MEVLLILLKLICAHLCADFIFQTDPINAGKRKPGIQGMVYQGLHSGIHAVTAYLFVAEWTCWIIPLVIFFSHYLIDFVKCKTKGNTLGIFLLDQLCHLVVILGLWFLLYGKEDTSAILVNINTTNVWLIGMAYILMLKPSSVLLSLFLEQWTPVSPNTQSQPNVGQWIGYIERVLILTFVLVGSIEGVGFLLAAKYVFRFGQYKEANDIRSSEYIHIGTLASFTLAILTGMAVSYLI